MRFRPLSLACLANLVVCVFVGAVGVASAQESPTAAQMTQRIALPQSPPELLSTVWMQKALLLVADTDISAEGIESVLEVAQACAALTPDKPAPWRIIMFLADQLEATRPDLALSARRSALANLARLEPRNDSITLARLSDAVESSATAEERVRAYEHLLDPKNAASLGAAVRSRLAYQLAMLQNRMGNTELFARWLGESVKIDPAFPQAALAAAGFFRTRIDDPAVDAELLSLAAEANPRDLSTWSALITVLLDGAAFTSAERVVRNAIVVATDERDWRATNNLTADLVTALWGQGRREEAQRELTLRVRNITDDYRRMLQFSDATLTAARIKTLYPPLPASLSLAGLALMQPKQDSEEFQRMVVQALQMSEQMMESLRTQGFAPHINDLLDKAVLSLLFKSDPSEVALLLEDSAKEGVISPAMTTRLQGMLDWRNKKYDDALRVLEPIRKGDSLAQYAYAMALVESGRTQEGARELHELAKSNVGTTLGLMALDRLSTILNQGPLLFTQLSPELATRAQLLNKAVQDNLPKSVDDLIAHPGRALMVKAEQVTSEPNVTPGPYSRLGFKITLLNQSGLTLSIGRTDPIISRLAMRASASVTKAAEAPPLPQASIPFDQALEVAPGGQIEFTIDSAYTPLGYTLAQQPLRTHLVSAAFVVNPHESGYGALPGFMGSSASTVPFTVTGVQVSPQWVAESMALIGGARSTEALVRMVLLAHAAAAPPEEMPEAARPALASADVFKAIADAWLTYEPLEQAWVVAAIPKETPAMAPLLDAIRSSTAPQVLTSWLLSRVTDPKDPMLDVARRTTEPRLIRLADSVAWVADRRYKRAIEMQGIGGDAAPASGARP